MLAKTQEPSKLTFLTELVFGIQCSVFLCSPVLCPEPGCLALPLGKSCLERGGKKKGTGRSH